MKKSLIIIVFGVLSITQLAAQTTEDLTAAQLLRSARSIYDQGRLHELPVVLETALKRKGKNQFTQSEKVEAYKILILTYIYLEEPQKADEKMIELLKTDNFFDLADSDPVELKSHYKKFRKYPVFQIGAKIGLNQTYVNTIKNYYILANSQGRGQYTPNLSLHYGISFEKALKKKGQIGEVSQFVMNPEIFLSTISFNYENSEIYQQDPSVEEGVERPSSVLQNITQNRFQVNLLMQYTIGKTELNRQLTPYVTAGPSIGYLTNSSFDGQHNIESRENVTGPVVNTERYKPIDLAVVGGVGARYKLGVIYISADLRYHFGLFNVVKKENRYKEDTPEMQKLIRQFAYVDNDFSLRTAVFNLGIIIPVFKPKKLIK